MDAQKEHRRNRKTKKALLDALIGLIGEKKVKHITVKEITEIADVNRSTFYFYYKDVFDMFEQLEADLFREFNDAFKKIIWDDNVDGLLGFFTYLFEFIQSNSDMFRIFLGPDGDYSFIEKLKDIIVQSQPPNKITLEEKEKEFYIPFVIFGSIGIIQQWLRGNMNTSPKEMACIVLKML